MTNPTNPTNPMIAEALQKGEDATGLCTVREAVAAMRENGRNEMSLWWVNQKGEGVRVDMQVRVLELRGTGLASRPEYVEEQKRRTAEMCAALDDLQTARDGITKGNDMNETGPKLYRTNQVQNHGDRAAPVLLSWIQQINERIGAIVDRQETANRALERLINPRPVNGVADKEEALRDPQSIEDHLRVILRRLDGVYSTASDQADSLNSAA